MVLRWERRNCPKDPKWPIEEWTPRRFDIACRGPLRQQRSLRTVTGTNAVEMSAIGTKPISLDETMSA